jgi:hypothetical protein
MSKKSKRRWGAGAAGSPPLAAPASRPKRVYIAALCALVLLSASAAATRFDPVRRAVGLRPLLAPVAQSQGGLPLAKEYVYAGGRLVATEEPTPTPAPIPAGPPPTGLTATATSASSVLLEWVAPTGAVGYVVERRSGPNAQTVEMPTGSTTPSFTDTTLPAGDFAYLYRVKAVYGSGFSDYGNRDLATTVVFTDPQLQPKVTRIKAVHLTELRRAVGAVRALAGGLAPASWTYPDPVSAPQGQRRKIYLEDVKDLRDRLDDALGPLNLLSPYPSSPLLARGAVVYAAHFEQIRARVR